MELMMEFLNKGMWLSLMLSLPCVLTAAGIGLIVGILQAVTQVQEQTIAAAPKILFVFLILIFGGGLMLNMMEDYIRESYHVAFNEIPQDGQFVLPPKVTDPARLRAKEFFHAQTGKLPSKIPGYKGLSIDSADKPRSSTQFIPAALTGKSSVSVSEEMMLNQRR